MKKNQANVGVIRIIGLIAALFSGFGMGGCVGGSTSSTFAGAEIVSQNSQLIGGELAEGRIGDMRMTNGKIRLIIQKPSSSINEQSIAPFGGNLIDIDGIREGLLGNDGLLELSTLVNFSTTPRYDEIKVIENGVVDGKAIVEVWGSLVRIPGRDWIGRIRRNWQQLGQAPSFLEDDHLGLEVGAIRVRTRYILRPTASLWKSRVVFSTLVVAQSI